MIITFLSGSLAGKSGKYRRFLIGGPLAITIGFVLLSMLDSNTSYLTVAIDLVALSIRGLGMSVGVAVFGNILSRELASRPASTASTSDAIGDMLVWGIPLAVVLLVLAFAIPNPTGSRS